MRHLDLFCFSGYNVGMNKITTKLVKDGNSTAIRIPKVALEMSGISGTVELVVEDGSILIKKPSHPRDGWARAIDTDKPEKDSEVDAWDALAGDGIID
jgi:antitoxin component of MazEF toxin-antitoxin module